MASGARPSEVASGELIPDAAACGISTVSIVGADGRVISVGILMTFFCMGCFGYDADSDSRVTPLYQMVVTAKHAARFKASGRVKRFENMNENIVALHALTRCSSDIAHCRSPSCWWIRICEGNMSAISHEACDIFHRLHTKLSHIRVSVLESSLIIS